MKQEELRKTDRQYRHYVLLRDYPSLQEELEKFCAADEFAQVGADADQLFQDIQRLYPRLEELGLSEEFHNWQLNYHAVETGQIEGLYQLNSGITETLILEGFHQPIINHADAAGQDADTILEQLRDHRGVLDGLFAFIKDPDPLNLAYIRNLHQKLCAHQDHTYAVDSLGQRGQIPLQKGAWKEQANNPRQEDGRVFHYCPPEQVQQEMDYLLDALPSPFPSPFSSLGPATSITEEKIHPVAKLLHHCLRKLSRRASRKNEKPSSPAPGSERFAALYQAAWLHHRFSLVHPFQDGNGRTARVLASLVLIRHGYYPLLVRREQRDHYLNALQAADRGDLLSLVRLILEFQQYSLEHGVRLCEAKQWEISPEELDRVRSKFEQAEQRQASLKMDWSHHPRLGEFCRTRLEELGREILQAVTTKEQQVELSCHLEARLRIDIHLENRWGSFGIYQLYWSPSFAKAKESPQYKISLVFLSAENEYESPRTWSIEELEAGEADGYLRGLFLRISENFAEKAANAGT